jgi:hypothetical protein
MSACPTRAAPELAATDSPTVALVFPLALLVMASQPLSLDVDQPHPVRVVTATASVPPVYPALAVVWLSE